MTEKEITLDAKAIIGSELAIQDINDVRIAKMREEYMPLTITNLKNEKQFDLVHRARMEVKKARVLVQNVSKKTREKAIIFQKDCITEEKRLVALLEPIETHLETEEGKVEAEKARIKAEAEAKEAARLQERINGLISLGCNFDGQSYFYGDLKAPIPLLKVATDEQFAEMFDKINAAVLSDAQKKALEEAARKAEADRIAKIQAEQEAERLRLEDVARKQAEEAARIKADQEAVERKAREEAERVAAEQASREAKIKADQDAIEAEKARIAQAERDRLDAIERENKYAEEMKKRQSEIEQAKKEAAEKAIKDAEEKAKREAAEKAAKEEAARIAAEKKAARAPDKVKLKALADHLENATLMPEMKTEEGKAALESFKVDFLAAIAKLRKGAEGL